MSYTKQTGIPCDADETVVKLDTGALVAVRCPSERDPQSNRRIFRPRARYIESDGTQQSDAAGHPVQTGVTHSASADELAKLTADVVARECLFLVLGEPLTADPDVDGATLVKFSATNVEQQSIRNAIATASVVAPTASEVL